MVILKVQRKLVLHDVSKNVDNETSMNVGTIGTQKKGTENSQVDLGTPHDATGRSQVDPRTSQMGKQVVTEDSHVGSVETQGNTDILQVATGVQVDAGVSQFAAGVSHVSTEVPQVAIEVPQVCY